MTDTYESEIEQAHSARVDRLRSASGWLSLVGKTFLSPGATAVELPGGAGIIGTATLDGNVVRFEAADGAAVTSGGEPVASRVLQSDRHGKADALHAQGFVLEVMERGDAFALRIRDTRELPRPYAGIERFATDPTWKVRARLEAYAEPREIDIDFEGATGAIADRFISPGVLVFERDGGEHRLEAVYEDSSKKRLFILFRDATSGSESYGLGRFVYAPLPNAQGEVLIDFNLAILPGCAFTVYATCPIPPRQNRLAIPVRAGEREYLAPAIGA
ncbi:MAG: hypothetical protein K0S65_4679 [Labilithrix sp.]|nr:hypothetical protein [Labilithrix sp.]